MTTCACEGPQSTPQLPLILSRDSRCQGVEIVSRTLGKLAREDLIALPGVYRVTLLRPDDLQEIAEGF